MILIWKLYEDYISKNLPLAILFWIFFVVGVIRILRQIYRMLAVSSYYCCKKRNVNTFAKYGNGATSQESKSWALITGASDGIGLGFCHELARRGFNIILLSRTKSKLENAAAEIEKEHGVKTFIVVRDLAKMISVEDYTKVVDEIP